MLLVFRSPLKREIFTGYSTGMSKQIKIALRYLQSSHKPKHKTVTLSNQSPSLFDCRYFAMKRKAKIASLIRVLKHCSTFSGLYDQCYSPLTIVYGKSKLNHCLLGSIKLFMTLVKTMT